LQLDDATDDVKDAQSITNVFMCWKMI